VWGTLADLALDDEPNAHLRNTLQVFLHTGTYTATAARLTLHGNTVLGCDALRAIDRR
jgi:DNA-binding PucR family transcriptional regulator